MEMAMRLLWFLIIAGGIAVTYFLIVRFRRDARRQRLMKKPFPEAWNTILERNLPPYSKLTSDDRMRLQNRIKVFLSEKMFEGCDGLAITDEIKVTIAAQACLLLLNRNEDRYKKLRTILVYPSTYVAGNDGLFVKHNNRSVRLGESWNHGVVVLAWDSVKQGAVNFKDGRNVAIHEFAHQLDQADGMADGAPILDTRSAYGSWAEVFSEEFLQLQKKKKKRKRSVFNKYGASHPAEFFAVVTEAFFEKPKQFEKKHPELYAELLEYYHLDPREWV